MFQWLFKYPAELYSRGTIEFAIPAGWVLALVVVSVLATGLFLLRRRRPLALGAVDLVLLTLCRGTVLALLIVSLARPVLVTAVPHVERGVVGVLLDDTLSMRIADQGDTPRADVVRGAFASDGALRRALERRFDVHLYRFSDRAQPLSHSAELAFAGTRTDVGQALADITRDLGDAPLAGIVVVSDGALGAPPPEKWRLDGLRAAGIPVHTVGVGTSRFARDVEVSRLRLPESVLAGSTVVAEVVLRYRGATDEAVELVLEDESRLLALEPVTLTPDRPWQTIRTEFVADEAGVHQLRAHVLPLPDERLERNNGRSTVLRVVDRRERILYFEGEPRFELKFARRAVAGDDNLQLVALVRTAHNKFYRIGIDNPDELAEGFPTGAEALFDYRGLVLGSVDTSDLSAAQLTLIAEFVSRRGGGLLLLGGRRSFTPTGYRDTPLADVAPVVIDGGSPNGFATEVTVQPTALGVSHPLARLGTTTRGATPWQGLPPLTVVHPFYRAKAGASVLLEGIAAELPAPLPILAAQRYGRGQVLVFNVQDSWRWQMHADVALDDQRHETLWRNLLRGLVEAVPDQVILRTHPGDVEPGESVEVTAELRDASFNPLAGAAVTLRVTTPLGEQSRLPMTESTAHSGTYAARFNAAHGGLYDLHVETPLTEPVAGADGSLLAVSESREYFSAEMDETLLRHLAAATGGRFHRPDDVSALAEAIPLREGRSSERQRFELWNTPAAFLVVLLLLACDWFYRRRRGLA